MKALGEIRCLALMICCLAMLLPGLAQQSRKMPLIVLQKVPEIGDRLSSGVLPKRPEKHECGVNSAQFDPCAESIIGGIRYTIAFRKNETGYFVTRVETLDKKFRSPQGLSVGGSISLTGPAELYEAPYFEVYTRRGTRWIPVVGSLGMVNISISADGLKGDKVEDLRAQGEKPLQLYVGGFIEAETEHSSQK